MGNDLSKVPGPALLRGFIRALESVRESAEELRARKARPDDFRELLATIDDEKRQAQKAAHEIKAMAETRLTTTAARVPSGVVSPNPNVKAPIGEPPHQGSGAMRPSICAEPTPGEYFIRADAKRGPRGKRGKRGKAGPMGPQGFMAPLPPIPEEVSGWLRRLDQRMNTLESCPDPMAQVDALRLACASNANRLSEALAQVASLRDAVSALYGPGPVVFSNAPASTKRDPE